MTLSKHVILMSMALLLVIQHAALGQTVLSARDAKREAVGMAVVDLLGHVDAKAATEKPRLGWSPEGHLRYFGAPPGVQAQVDTSLKGLSADEAAKAFVSDYALAFGIDSPNVDFEAARVRRTGERTNIRLDQTYGGLPVFAASMIVQLSESGGIEAVLSDVMTKSETLDKDSAALTPTISAEAAQQFALADAQPRLKAAIDAYEADLAKSSDENEATPETVESIRKMLSQMELTVREGPELVVYDPAVLGRHGKPVTAWMLTIRSTEPALLCERVFVDARVGETVFSYSLIQAAKDREIWDYDFGLSSPDLMRTETSDPVPSYFPYAWRYNTNFDCLGMAYDYFSTNHGWDSFDNTGSTIRSYLRYYAKANAEWDPVGEFFGFGLYLTSVGDDCVGHEYTHGVTHHTSQLVYAYESGAINESMSDIWGEFIDWSGGWSNDDPEDKWWIMEDTLLILGYRHMRYPLIYDDPEIYKGEKWWTEDSDNGGVHVNCGVGNKLCFLLTDGDSFEGYTIASLGESTVRDLYWECQTSLLCPASDYTHLYFALKQAAVNLNLSQSQRENIENACRAVNIAQVSAFTIRNGEGSELLQFQSDGDVLVMRGVVVENASAAQMTPSSTRAEWMLKLGATGILALLNPDDGNFYIKGAVVAQQGDLSDNPNIAEFVLRDAQGTTLALIDSQGNLRLRGRLYQNYNPFG